ncbi:zinc-dependent metalloprotease family protein [Flavobacterium poyangense]|uniref:zinc-dependent metalloprotease family protein n=1 Tax=Flavobacterium poyangense TaxID=2204302 RepID=UPI001420B4EB|nr:zinc-dependent metalloprotease family protein [Flavobacterium sp. JXAS1]
MKRNLTLGLIMIIIIASCSKNSEDETIPTKEIKITTPVQPDGNKAYKISQLPKIPDFATPIIKEGEKRSFTLIKDDGSKLNFILESSKQQLFGKMRTFTGSVNLNGSESGKAIMIIGENGFELFFEDNTNAFFHIDSKENLDIGYKNISLDFDNNFKTIFLDLAKKQGQNGETLISNFRNRITRSKTSGSKFQNRNNYNLENSNSLMGVGHCSEPKIYTPSNLRSSESKKNSSNADSFNMEVVYMDPNYDFLPSYVNLIFSFMKLKESKYGKNIESYFSAVPTVSQYTIPTIQSGDTQEQIKRNASIYFEYMLLLDKKPDPDAQYYNLGMFTVKNPDTSKKNLVRCLLYGDSWDKMTLGMANIGAYVNSTNLPPGPYAQSILISSSADYDNKTLAHECGHALGAFHDQSNIEDLMFPNTTSGAGKKAIHFNISNIEIIKSDL